MKLVVLSRGRSVPSTRRLADAAAARDHSVRVLNPLKLELLLHGNRADLFYRRKKLSRPDVVMPRIGASIAAHAMPLLDTFEAQGVPLMNTPRAIGLSRNPVRVLQRLATAGLEVPRTLLARDPTDLKEMVSLVGGTPVLVKLLRGHERKGVMVCESPQSLLATLEAVIGLGHNIIVQEYLKQTGRDVRVFVVGGQVLAAARRIPRPGTLSRTLARIARLEPVTLTASMRDVAERAAALCELEVCAVDMLVPKKGQPRVFEVNASPSIPEMEDTTGVNLSLAIVKHAETLLNTGRRVASVK